MNHTNINSASFGVHAKDATHVQALPMSVISEVVHELHAAADGLVAQMESLRSHLSPVLRSEGDAVVVPISGRPVQSPLHGELMTLASKLGDIERLAGDIYYRSTI